MYIYDVLYENIQTRLQFYYKYIIVLYFTKLSIIN